MYNVSKYQRLTLSMTVEETLTIQKVSITIHFGYKMPQNVGCLNIYYFYSELITTNWVSHKNRYAPDLMPICIDALTICLIRYLQLTEMHVAVLQIKSTNSKSAVLYTLRKICENTGQ